MTADRTFVDTNVLLYAVDVTAGDKHHRARALVGRLWAEGSGCLSTQVLGEFHVTITRKVPEPVPPGIGRRLVNALCHWRVHAPTCDDLTAAIDLQQDQQVSFWDALILTSAAALGCRRVLSEDLNPGQRYGEVLVENPFVD